MFARTLVAFAAAFILVGAAASTQLGPKDGSGLPATDLERIKVGQAAPDFTLENVDGKPVTLSEFRAKKNVLLVFYRGQW
jgi:cytochrome oxidase Cu insertion factor (SCO1/SenC/PrrC family)